MSSSQTSLAARRRWLKGAAAALTPLMGLGAYQVIAKPKEVVIKMTVKRFEFSRKTITLKKGVPVLIEITSLDVPHGFSVPDFNARAEIVMPGKATQIRFTPDKVGEFIYLCDVFCGAKHEEVQGKFIVRA